MFYLVNGDIFKAQFSSPLFHKLIDVYKQKESGMTEDQIQGPSSLRRDLFSHFATDQSLFILVALSTRQHLGAGGEG